MRDWVTNVRTTHNVLGSVLGPHPFPMMVRDFQAVIGKETLTQVKARTRKLPEVVVACVGGGSNAAGIFSAFVPHREVRLVGVEAGGVGDLPGQHAARFGADGAAPGILHGTHTWVLQDGDGQVLATHSVSAGLDYPAVGPEHASWHDSGRVSYTRVDDREALDAFHLLAETEGLIPALESAHAIAWAVKMAPTMRRDEVIVVNLSGRGDKDLAEVVRIEGRLP
jgi:tryptophan synthase beta chain